MLLASIRFALRALQRRLDYTAVNVIGLTVGLACCAMAAVFLQYEWTWDRHHEDADRIYRIVAERGEDLWSTIPFEGREPNADEQRSLLRRLTQEIPAVEQAAQFTIFRGPESLDYIETPDADRYTSPPRLVTNTGPAVADLFTFERVAGAPLDEALTRPGSAVLTQSTARAYFGDDDPVGRRITIRDGADDRSVPLTVRAVVADPPSNSRLQFGIAMQVKTISEFGAFRYLRLADGTDPAAVVPQVEARMHEVNPELRDEDETWHGAHLQALTDIYLDPPTLYDEGPTRNAAYLWVFAAIGGLVLVITTINYANLSLALSTDRAAEIGIRKAVGGHRSQIARQLLVEAALLALMCAPLALGVCAAVLPAFNALMETQIAASRLLQPVVLTGIAGLALATGLAAGGYPAMMLTREQAVDLFDGTSSPGRGTRGWSLRHGLIALQFVVLIGLGSLSWVAYDQLRFMQTETLGYDPVGVIEVNSIRGDSDTYAQFRRRALTSSAVQSVGMGSAVPDEDRGRQTFAIVEDDGDRRSYDGGRTHVVDVHWFEVMGIDHPVVDSMRAQGPSAPPRWFVNEAAASLVGGNPMGKAWSYKPSDPEADGYPIAGVLPDLHLISKRTRIPPTVYRVFAQSPWAGNAVVRFAPERIDAGMQHVREVWSEVRPDTPLSTTFLDARLASLYQQDRQFTALAGAMGGLAMLLAVIGLASLVAYLTRLRTKEIGIRKALGGSVASILLLLNREYVQIVGVSVLVGAPLAGWIAHAWLGQFAYQVSLSPVPFLATGATAFVVALVAVSLQALPAARVDPAKVLRRE